MSSWLTGCLPALKTDDTVSAAASAEHGAPSAPSASGCEVDALDVVNDAPSNPAALNPAEPPALLIETLSQELPNWSPECSACVLSQCDGPLRACASDAACADFVQCRWGKTGDVSPGGELRCGVRHGRSPELDASSTRQLSNCWANACVTPCQLGRQWACLDNYAMPPPDSSSFIDITQTLQKSLTDAPIVGATVRFCGLFDGEADCETTYEGLGCSDGAGLARATVRAATDDRPGWLGYRHVIQPGILDALLQTNLRIPLSRSMLQHVPSLFDLSILAAGFGTDLSLGNVVFQVFDCAHTGAQGAVIELLGDAASAAETADTRIGYRENTAPGFTLVPGQTLAAGNGGGSIQNLRAAGLVSARVVLEETGQEIALPVMRITPGRILLLEIHPQPAP